MRDESNKIRIAPFTAMSMVGRYARQRLVAQIKALAFIVVYLLVFQIILFGTAPANAWRMASGIGMVWLGLTLFLEGIMLGLMPLGEKVGLKLPQRTVLGVIVVFGLLLGMVSTFAEPAIAALRTMGGTVKAWEAPLLYALLENDPEKLVIAIGVGVGIAVGVGMVRLYFGWSIKPFVYAVIPLLLAVSSVCAMNENLAPLLGLAWDTGAVTTGPVTVPLVMALGIGVSRSIGKLRDGTGGFGVVMLASAFPVLAVLVLGMLMNSSVPNVMSESSFFQPEHRAQSMRIFPSETALRRHAYQHGSERARMAFYDHHETYRESIRSLADPDRRRVLLGEMTLSDWLRTHASDSEKAWVWSHDVPVELESLDSRQQPWLRILRRESAGALRSVIPLAAVLLLVLLFFLRDRFQHYDEIVLGITMSLIGMALLTTGIRTGLAPLGDQVGRSMPYVFMQSGREVERIVLEPFDMSRVHVAYDRDGREEYFFYLRNADGELQRESFDPRRYDAETGTYEHVVMRQPVLPGIAGIGLVFVFAFGLGYGSTLAEPALNALGRKLEEISVGTIKSANVVRAVSLGVGFGLMAGVLRILYEIPLLWLIVPPYVVLLWLTRCSEEDFAGVAWDCGGVTTGPVTVPLVMAMGLGLGGELDVIGGFGTLAMASAYPIVTVMVYGFVVRARQRRSMHAMEEVDED